MYTRETHDLLDVQTDDADGLLNWFDKIGPDYARWYGKPWVPVERDLGEVIVEECEFYAQFDERARLDPLAVASMTAHESAGGQSEFYIVRHNPSGIGAVNDSPNDAIWFPHIRAGIRATVARLLCYVLGAGPWEQDAPRASIIKANGWYATVRYLMDLEQKWAYTPEPGYSNTEPARRYGGNLASLMNDAATWITTGSNDRPRIITPAWMDCLISTGHAGRPGLPLDYGWVTFHDTDNRSAGADEGAHCGYLQGGAGGRTVSWHATIGDSGFWQHLPWDEVGWHAGDGYSGTGNRESLAIEGTVDAGQNFELAYQNWVHGAAWFLDRKSLGAERLVQHNHWRSQQFPTGKNCPRWLRDEGKWGQFVADVTEMINATPNGDAPVVNDPNARYYTEYGGKWIINSREVRMLEFFESLGGVASEGYPMAGMIQNEDGVYRQLMENSLLEFWPAENVYRRGGLGQRYGKLYNAATDAGVDIGFYG